MQRSYLVILAQQCVDKHILLGYNISVKHALPEKKSKSLILYFSYLPILFLLALIFGVTSFVGVRSLSTKNTKGSVLSKGSGSDGSDDNKDDGNDDKDKSDDDNKDDGKDSDKDNNDDDDNDGVLDLDEDEFGSSGEKQKTKQTITNPDGTTSEVRREVEKDGEIKVEIRTFDAEGNKIMVEKYESGDGEEKSRVKTYDATGTKLSDFRFKTEDGKELELRVKEGDVELQRVKFNVDKNELIVRTGDESRIRIRTDQNNFVVSREGANAISKFPISIDDATGEIFVKTPAGDVQLKAMPDTIVQKAQVSDDLDVVEGVELNTQDDKASNLEYVVTGTKSEKLLGVFALNIPSSLIYDAQTGEFVRNDQGFVTRILNLFSF